MGAIPAGAWFFDSWSGILRVLIVGLAAYVALVLILRTAGKRTLSTMDAFDFVVTVAMGSTLANVPLSKDVALVEGMLGLALLIGLQWLVTWLSVRSERWRQWMKSEPRLVVFRGELLHEALRSERLTPDEVYAAVRAQGFSSMEHVYAVVLETDGSMSVLTQTGEAPPPSALNLVRGFPRKT